MKQNPADVYRRWTEIIARMRKLKLTAVDLVPVMNEPTGTISSRLSGYSPMLPEHREKIEAFLEKLEVT